MQQQQKIKKVMKEIFRTIKLLLQVASAFNSFHNTPKASQPVLSSQQIFHIYFIPSRLIYGNLLDISQKKITTQH